MKTKFIFSSFILILFYHFSLAQAALDAQKANYKEVLATHKSVAILPFLVTPDVRKVGNKATTEQVDERAKADGYKMQKFFYDKLLQKANYTVSFQDIEQTNDILKKNFISYTKLDRTSKDEIAKILKVDGVIYVKVVIRKLGTYTDAILSNAPTEEAEVNISIFDDKDAEAMWAHRERIMGQMMNSDALVKMVLRYISRNFPYEK
jgi:hypothetical protein